VVCQGQLDVVMRIACILTVFPSVTETFIFGDLRALKDSGHDVGLMHFLDGSCDIWQKDARVLRENVLIGGPLVSPGVFAAFVGYLVRRPIRLIRTLLWIVLHRGSSIRGRLKTLLILPKCVQFASECKRWRADRVHAAWSNHAAIAALVIQRLNGTPFSMASHAGQDVFRDPVMLREKVAGASFVAVCNRATFGRLLEIADPEDHRKLVLLSHGVDLETFDVERSAPQGSSPRRIVFVGRLAYGKGIAYLIEAARLLHEGGVEFRLDLFGDGPERAATRESIEQLGIADQVQMYGEVSQEDVAGALVQADLLVLPSELRHDGGREGLPNVLLEAMAAGVPVVASRIASVEQAVQDGVTGLLVPQRDPESLATAMRRVFDEPELTHRRVVAAREMVRESFDRKVCGRRFVSLFEETR